MKCLILGRVHHACGNPDFPLVHESFITQRFCAIIYGLYLANFQVNTLKVGTVASR